MAPSLLSRLAGPIVLSTGLLMVVALTIIAGGILGFQALVPPFGLPLGVALASLGVWMTRGSIAGAKRAGLLATAAFVVIGVVSTGCSLTGTPGDGPITTETRQTERSAGSMRASASG